MDSNGAHRAWMRFTLLDLLIFVMGFAAGSSQAIIEDRSQRRIPPPWGVRSTSVDLVVQILIFGSAMSGPIVLITQWLVRKRRVGLTSGEWLWLALPSIYLAAWLMARFHVPLPCFLAVPPLITCIAAF